MKSRVVVVAIIEKGSQILMGYKSKSIGPYPKSWHIPGGGVHLGEESFEEAIRREVREETNIEIDALTQITFSEDQEKDKHGEMTHYIFLAYKTQYKSGEVAAADDMENLEWVDKKKLKKLPLARPSKKLFKELGWI